MKGLLFVYAVTYGGAIASLVNPFYGLLVYVTFAILRPETLWAWSVPPGNYSRIVAGALLLGWAVKGFGSWRFSEAKWVVGSLVAYFGWEVFSATQAVNQELAWGQVEVQAKIFLPWLVGLTLIDSISQLKMLAWAIVLSMGYVAFEANVSFWAGNNWLRWQGFGGMDNNSICIGMVAVSGLAFFLGLSEQVKWKRGLAFLVAALTAHAPMFANSRGGMLGLFVTGLVAFWLIPKKPLNLAIFFMASLVAIRLAGPQVLLRFSTIFSTAESRDSSAQSRLDLWADCLDVMQRFPLTGLGPDNWPTFAGTYGWPIPKEAHSLWFNAGAELGFPGLIFLLAFYGFSLWHALRLTHKSHNCDPFLQDVGRMVVVALAGFAVSASFVSLDNLEPPYYIALIGAGAIKLAGASRTSFVQLGAAMPPNQDVMRSKNYVIARA